MQPIRLVIAEGRTLFRQGLVALLRAEADFEVSEAADTDEVRRVCLRVQPDLILLDAALPDGSVRDEPAVMAALRVACPQAAIVVLGGGEKASSRSPSAGTGDIERRRALRMGAASYLRPTVDRTELLRTLRAIATRQWEDTALSPPAHVENAPNESATLRDPPSPDITERERTVSVLIAQGLCNKEVAHRLGISTQTVKNHVSHLLEKLALADRTQLAVYAIEHHFEG